MKKFAVFLTTILGLAALTVGAHAATVPSPEDAGQALEIAPPVISLKADPGQTVTAQINLRGISQQTLLVTSQVNDFVAAGEDGTPKVLLEEQEDNPYSLRTWVGRFPQLTLKPRQIETMQVTVTVPRNAAPGGYYGVVRFTATPPELDDTGVALSASLGSLLFVRVNGDAKEALSVEEFAVTSNGLTGTLFESAPLKFFERLKNTGNTHVEPAGQITITDMFGQKVATLNVNLPPRNILPQSIRKFEQAFDSSVIGDKFLFGRYTADMRLKYGDSKQELTASTTFWVIPYRLIVLIIILLVGGFFLLRFLMRRYNQRVVRKSQGGGLRMGSKRK